MNLLLISLAFATATRLITPAEDTAQVRRQDLMNKLRSGGYTVLLRHARTDYSVQETPGTIPAERSAQRNLSDDGIRDAALMGVVFRKYGVSFAEVISSPMYRTVETAEMAAGKPVTTMDLRVFPATPAQAALVAKAPKPGTNRLLVTHHFVIETHVPGVKPGDVAESEAAVVRHTQDGKLQLVGIIKLDDWKALANPGYGTTPTPPPSRASEPKLDARPVAFPDTRAGRTLRGYVAAFNSGNAGQMRAFIESSFVPSPERPTDERMKTFARLLEDYGTLQPVSVDSSSAERVTMGVTSKRGTLLVTLRLSPSDTMRVASLTFAVPGGGHP